MFPYGNISLTFNVDFHSREAPSLSRDQEVITGNYCFLSETFANIALSRSRRVLLEPPSGPEAIIWNLCPVIR